MKKTVLLLIFFFLIFFLLFFSFSLSRLYSLQIFHYDFGIFAKIIWQLSRFQLPFIDHRVLGNIVFLGDHFNPSLIILAPLFWLTSNIKILLFEQALATVSMGVMIFLIARKLNFSYFPSLIFSFVFLIFAGVENPLVTDWHPEPTAGFFLLLFFYLFNFTNYKLLSYLSAFIFLGFKESNALTLIFLLTWMFFVNLCSITKSKEQVARGEGLPTPRNEVSSGGRETRDRIWKTKSIRIIILSLFSIFWFFVTTKFMIPLFSHQPYMYSPDIPLSPIKMLTNYFNNPLKTKLIFDSFISFGFLPIFSLFGLIPIFLELGVRLIPNNSIFQNFALTFHYNVYLGIFLSLASIYGVKNIFNLKAKISVFLRLGMPPSHRRGGGNPLETKKHGIKLMNIILVYLLLTSLYTSRKITISPINFAISSIFWKELKPRQDFFDALKLIPKTGSVMSQNNIIPHLVTRKERVYFLKENYEDYKPDILIMDLNPGQNPNNFWDTNYETAIIINNKLLKDKSYKNIKTSNKTIFIFIRNK